MSSFFLPVHQLTFKRIVKRISAAVFVGILTFILAAQYAEAKRLGGGRSIGRQSSMVHHAYKPSSRPSAQPQHPSPSSPAQQARNRWLGPIAGLAAGLGIAALMSHLGLGGALGGMLSNLIMIGLLIFAVYLGIRWFRRNRALATNVNVQGGKEPAFNFAETLAPAAASASPAPAASSAPLPLAPLTSDTAALKMGEDQPAYSSSSMPSAFDTNTFLDTAKVLFLRLQAAWDAGDLEDISTFTTPEMFAQFKLDHIKRGTAANRTNVMRLDAELVGMEAHSNASVRFSGSIDEGEGKGPQPFAEIWNLIKRNEEKESWLLVGIQQLNQEQETV